jgi:hypothetical protein
MPALEVSGSSALRREREANVRRQGRLAERQALLAAYAAERGVSDEPASGR